MTNPNYTHLTLVVDRSGSMHSMKKDAQGGIDALLDEQFAIDLPFTLTLIEFDNSIDNVVSMATERPSYTLVPRGGTALFDAVGSGIATTGSALSQLAEDDRPGNVIFVIVTDGGENSSHEYNLEAVKSAIKTQKDNYNWTFQFIGADDAAWQGSVLGVTTTRYNNTAAGNAAVYASMSTGLTATRSSGIAFAMPETINES